MHTQKAALWLAEHGQAGLAEFDRAPTTWGVLDGYHLFTHVYNCDTGHLIAHPNPGLHRLKTIENFTNTFKDFDGRLTGVEFCTGVRKNPRGVWAPTRQTFVRSVTGLKEPFSLLGIFVQVPGTSWQVLTYYLVEVASLEQLDAMAADLNELVDKWSIIK